MSAGLGFGLMRLPKDKDERIILDKTCEMVDAFIGAGFTYFDTAYMYHNHLSECVVRDALVKRHARNSFTLASKLPTMMLSSGTNRLSGGGMTTIFPPESPLPT